MKKKILSLLSICTLGLTAFAIGAISPVDVDATDNIVYVASNGSDTGDGSSASPYATLDKALTAVEDGGTIVLQDIVKVNEWTAHGKSVTITGSGLDASGDKAVEINDSVIFTNMHFVVDSDAYVYANGYETTVGTGVSWSNEIRIFGGGKEGTTVAGTSLTLLSGTYSHIYGGSYQGTVTGDTNLVVGGTVNNSSAVDTAIKNHTGKYYVFGGGHSANVIGGRANLTVQDSAKAVYVFGGTHGWVDLSASGSMNGYVKQGTNVKITGGTMMGVYGGSQGWDVGGNVNMRIEGGSIQQIFGANEGWPFRTGNVDLRIVGGTVSRRIYAGCYNADNGSIFNLGLKTDYHVENGKINLEIGGNASIPLNTSDSDRGIYARSRCGADLEDCQLVFSSQSAYDAYKNKLGGSDWGARTLMGSTSAADDYHYYTYEKSGDTITQTCAYHTDLHAQASAVLNKDGCLYTGKAVTPVSVDLDTAWEYDKPTLSYTNNVEIGKAKYTLTAGQVCVESDFVIVATPTMLGASVRLSTPCGLRFESMVSSALVDTGATFGTLMIPKEELGGAALTVNTAEVSNVPQTKWATGGKENGVQDGYEYFNAVLTEIPEEHYDKVIVARSYVYANGQYYYSDTEERSVAQVAALRLQMGDTHAALYDYVDKALTDSTLSLTSAVELYDGESCQLTLSGHKGYAVIWSTDSDLITVDKDGKITAGNKEGTAIVTAKVGSRTVQCEVTISYIWTGYY